MKTAGTFITALLLVLAAAAVAFGQQSAPTPLARAHAHNDYLHDRPLLDALAHGFSSVEADIFLVDGKLLVAHTRAELKPGRTLERLYLDPLRQRIGENGGRVYRGGPAFSLLIDVKSDAEATYAALRPVLAQYADILTAVRHGVVEEKAVTVIVSGNRAQQTIASDPLRFAGLDGRLTDLESDQPAHLMPWISDNWRNHFSWQGKGPMPQPERDKLRVIVEQSHAKHRRVRFWATPDGPAAWKELLAAGVDLINTDDLAGLEQFLLTNNGG